MGFLMQTLQVVSFTAKRIKEYGPSQKSCNEFLSGLESIRAVSRMLGQQSVVDNLIRLVSANENDDLWSMWTMMDATDPKKMSAISILYLGMLAEFGFPVQKAISPIQERLSKDNNLPVIFYACTNSLWMLGDINAAQKMSIIMEKMGYTDSKQFKNDQIVEFVLMLAGQ